MLPPELPPLPALTRAEAELIDRYLEVVDLLGRMAARWGGHPALGGLQVVNEPRWDIPTALLQDVYRRAYDAIRAHAPAGTLTVVFHDGFRPAAEYAGFFDRGPFEDVLYDVHRYHCFEPADLALDVAGHIAKAGVGVLIYIIAVRKSRVEYGETAYDTAKA